MDEASGSGQEELPGERRYAGPQDHAIERALTSVPGVARARVLRSAAGEPGRLRLRLKPGQEAAAVARSVAATLAERFDLDVDPAGFRIVGDEAGSEIDGAPPPTVPGPLVARRASIARIAVTRADGNVQVSIALARDDQRVVGTARTLPDSEEILDAIAEATAVALRQLTVRPVGVEVLEVLPEPATQPDRMLVRVLLQAGRGDEHLLGASEVRGDPEKAVVRATLDAVNRRVEPLLDGEGARPAGS